MANHKSALKRIRQSRSRSTHNHYYAKSTRTAIKQYRSLENKNEAEEKLPKLMSRIDRLAKKNIIHKNKAANLKSSLVRQLQEMS
ncbi:MAG: 30S ribosomal protein S20 [Bacteroidales bacterium]|nr:30S ribosomal protein S20 [Bacteroidales bacterium]